MIDPFASADAGKAEVRNKVKELILEVNELSSMVESLVTIMERVPLIKEKMTPPKPQPAPWSQTSTVERTYVPIGDGDKFWTDLSGMTIPRTQVPDEVIAQWEMEHSGGI